MNTTRASVRNPVASARRTEILKATTQPIRLAISKFLRRGEEWVCRIFLAIGGNQPNISKYLVLMKKAGLPPGRTVTFCWIEDPSVVEILDLVDKMIRREPGLG